MENPSLHMFSRMGEVEAAVLDGEMSESQAVEELIGVFDKSLT